MPMKIVGGAVAQVFFQKASEAHNHTGNVSRLVEDVFRRLVSLSIFPVLVLMLIGKDLFIVIFGERWAEAGVYIQILGLWIFFSSYLRQLAPYLLYLRNNITGCFYSLLFIAPMKDY